VNSRLKWLLFGSVWGTAILVAMAASWFFDVSIWLALAIAVGAFVINGVLLAIGGRGKN